MIKDWSKSGTITNYTNNNTSFFPYPTNTCLPYPTKQQYCLCLYIERQILTINQLRGFPLFPPFFSTSKYLHCRASRKIHRPTPRLRRFECSHGRHPCRSYATHCSDHAWQCLWSLQAAESTDVDICWSMDQWLNDVKRLPPSFAG